MDLLTLFRAVWKQFTAFVMHLARSSDLSTTHVMTMLMMIWHPTTAVK